MAAIRVWSKLLLLGFTVLAAVSAGPSIIVSHSPEYMRFKKDAGQIATSEIDSLISSTFGHSIKKDLKWKGLEQGSLFHRPKANILISLEGVQDLNVRHVAKFPVDSDEISVNTPQVANRLEDRPNGQKSFIVDFSENNVYDMRAKHQKYLKSLPFTLAEIRDHVLGDSSAFANLNLGTLNITRDEDTVFLGELQVIHEVIRALQVHKSIVKDNSPDLFHFRVNGMNRLSSLYGARSQPLLDAHRLLNIIMDRVTADFKALYGGNVVVEIVTLPDVDSLSRVRKTRSLLQDKDTAKKTMSLKKQLGMSAAYDADFAAIFNIILWTMVVLVLVLIAVSCSMWNMEPSDSLIYRMTSTRIKKD